MLSHAQKAKFCQLFAAAYADYEKKTLENDRHTFCFQNVGRRLSDPACSNKDFDILMAAVEAELEHRVSEGYVEAPHWWKNKSYWRSQKGPAGAPTSRQRWRASGSLSGEVANAIAKLKTFGVEQNYVDSIARKTGCLDDHETNYSPENRPADKLQPMLNALRRTIAAKQKALIAENCPF